MTDVPKTGEFCWYELATNNVQAAKDFYGKLFGWKFSDHQVDTMTYTMIKKNDSEFGGIWAIPKDQEKQIPPHWMNYILVENLDEALQNVEKAGGNIMKPAANAGTFGRFAIIVDPTGAHVALWQTLMQK